MKSVGGVDGLTITNRDPLPGKENMCLQTIGLDEEINATNIDFSLLARVQN